MLKSIFITVSSRNKNFLPPNRRPNWQLLSVTERELTLWSGVETPFSLLITPRTIRKHQQSFTQHLLKPTTILNNPFYVSIHSWHVFILRPASPIDAAAQFLTVNRWTFGFSGTANIRFMKRARRRAVLLCQCRRGYDRPTLLYGCADQSRHLLCGERVGAMKKEKRMCIRNEVGAGGIGGGGIRGASLDFRITRTVENYKFEVSDQTEAGVNRWRILKFLDSKTGFSTVPHN